MHCHNVRIMTFYTISYSKTKCHSQVEHKYQERTKSDCPKLGKLHSSYTWLKDGKKQPSSSSSGTPKTSTAGSASGGSGSPATAATAKYTDPNYV